MPDDSLHDTRPQPPTLPPEMEAADATRVQNAASDTKELAALVQRPPAASLYPEKPKRGGLVPPPPVAVLPPRPLPLRKSASASPPIWSVALMLVIVAGMVGCSVALLLALGGRTPPPKAPILEVVTAVLPTNTPFVPADLAPTPLPNTMGLSGTLPAFALVGPTLPPVVISPTPRTMTVGDTVFVAADESGVNVRQAPGIQNLLLFVAPDSEQFTIIGGPTQADGLTWWQIQSPADATRLGWAAAAYLTLPPDASGAP